MNLERLRISSSCFSASTIRIAALAAGLAAAATGRADIPITTLHGAPASFFGSAIALVGDIDGDGVGDIAVGAPNEDVIGAAYVYSGANLNLLFRFQDAAGCEFGAALAGVGDVDRDGVRDIAVGAPCYTDSEFVSRGAVFVYSGRDGQLIHRFLGASEWERLGTAVAAAGDLDGDGYADLAAGAPDATIGWFQSGRVHIYSGQLGSVLLTLTGPTEDFRAFGRAIAAVGDVDDDGRADLAVGAPSTQVVLPADPSDPYAWPTTLAAAGAVAFYSGANGSLIRVRQGWARYEYLGWALAAAGDRNGDAIADVIAGASMSSGGGAWGGGAVYTISGADGAVLASQFGSSMYGRLGWSVAAGDVNNDGASDVLAGAPRTGGGIGAAFVYSGAGGAPLAVHEGEPYLYAQIGSAVAVIADLNGDGIADYAVGAATAGDGGAVYLYAGRP
jgi:hypothetical protein